MDVDPQFHSLREEKTVPSSSFIIANAQRVLNSQHFTSSKKDNSQFMFMNSSNSNQRKQTSVGIPPELSKKILQV